MALTPYLRQVEEAFPLLVEGRVVKVVGLTLEVEGLKARIGEICRLSGAADQPPLDAEVVGFRDDRLLLMPLGEIEGVRPASRVVAERASLSIPVGHRLLGRVLDGLGRPIDDRGPVLATETRPIYAAPPSPLERSPIEQPLVTGVRVLDGLLTCGKGQRLGIFSGSGVGKSTLLGMIARHALTDVNVIALIGERGREVGDFLERDLGPEGLARSVVVVSTSDQAPMLRLKGALVATTMAEWFRDQGQDVLFFMDSVTRFAMAQREVGLATGEPPTTRGYTPSVYSLLPKLMERAGTSSRGSITGLYTVLVEGDDLNEPVSDTVRSILDGHVVLSREAAAAGQYPPVDVLASVSRAMPRLVAAGHGKLAQQVREVLAVYRKHRDLIHIGAYEAGTNPAIDRALEVLPAIEATLRQEPGEFSSLEETLDRLAQAVQPGGAADGADPDAGRRAPAGDEGVGLEAWRPA